MVKKMEVIGLTGFPIVKPGDDLGALIVKIAKENGVVLKDRDIIVVSQKIVSKAENRIVNLKSISPSEEALFLARIAGKDPSLVQLILDESVEIIKVLKGHIIAKTRHGIVCANAGIDRSNVAGNEFIVTLLPKDPDKSAELIRRRIEELTGKRVAVIITDTYGRPLRRGQINMAIGISGLKPFRDYRGLYDLFGYKLRVKRITVADEIAAAAELVMGNGAEGIPVVIVRGANVEFGEGSGKELNMPESRWFFR